MANLLRNGSFENYAGVIEEPDPNSLAFNNRDAAMFEDWVFFGGTGPWFSSESGYEFDYTQWYADHGNPGPQGAPWNQHPDFIAPSDGDVYQINDNGGRYFGQNFDPPLAVGTYRLTFDFFVETGIHNAVPEPDNRTTPTGGTASFSIRDQNNQELFNPSGNFRDQYILDSRGATVFDWQQADIVFDITSPTSFIQFGTWFDRGFPPLVYMDNFNLQVICFNRGTMIETEAGAVCVEDLAVGQKVLTADGEYRPIRWIGSRKLTRAQFEVNPKLLPIRIQAGALGPNMPEKDLIVSQQHRILVRSEIAERMFDEKEVLIPANKLLALKGIDILRDIEEVEYWHFLFDSHQVVMSNGAPTESLFTGPQALKAVSAEAREEIVALFPEIALPGYVAMSARKIPERHKDMKRLVHRHRLNRRPLIEVKEPALN